MRKLSWLLIHSSPQRLLLVSFALAILIGTLLLLLPWAHPPGKLSPLDALFTATSAVCVTGLTVVSTGRDLTPFGGGIVLALIQVGGLGIMSFAALAYRLGGARLPLSSQSALEDSLLQRDAASEFAPIFWRMLRLVAVIEVVGAVVLFLTMLPERETAHAAYSSLFHAISAFCNAGFSLYDDSLVGMRDNSPAILTISVLIVLGGLGHTVLLEVYGRLRSRLRGERPGGPQRFSLHCRVVLGTTLVLLIGGSACLYAFGLGDADKSSPGLIAGGFFQAVTARTAGFNTVPIGSAPLAAVTVLIMLMFVGGSPGSCAGGIKTTSLAIGLARLKAAVLGREDVVIFDRLIPAEVVLRATALTGLSLLWNGVGVLVLGAAQPAGTALRDIVFEQVSAFATVGLSTGLTAQLTVVSRLWIICTMFVGRLGPLTVAFSFLTARRPLVGYPKGKVMIG